MVTKVNGFSQTGVEALTGNLDFFTVRTLEPILTDGQDEGTPVSGEVTQGDATTQAALDLLIETISQRAQPVILSNVAVSREAVAGITDLPAVADDGDTNDTVYVFKFAIEHTEAWDADLLAEALDSANGVFVFRTPTTNNNVAIVRNATL